MQCWGGGRPPTYSCFPHGTQHRGQWTVDKLTAHQEPFWVPSFRLSNLWGFPFEGLSNLTEVELGPLYTPPPPNTQIIPIPARLSDSRRVRELGLGRRRRYMNLKDISWESPALQGTGAVAGDRAETAITRAPRLLGPLYFLFPVFEPPSAPTPQMLHWAFWFSHQSPPVFPLPLPACCHVSLASPRILSPSTHPSCRGCLSHPSNLLTSIP